MSLRNLAFFLAGVVVAIAINGFAEPYAGMAIGTEGKRQTTSVFAGYKYHGWFGELVQPSFQTKEQNAFLRDDGPGLGGGISTTFESISRVSSTTVAFNVGRLFSVASMEIGPFAGVHHYRQGSASHSRLVEINQATGEAIIDRTEVASSERTGFAPTYGLMFSVPAAARHLSIIGRLTKYQAIDRCVLEFGLKVSL